MRGFFLMIGLLGASLRPALAQRVVQQTVPLAAGQTVVLNLKYAHAVRLHPGAGGLRVEARVSINDNQLNDAYQLDVASEGGEVRVTERVDEAALKAARFTGPCPAGIPYGDWRGGRLNGSCVVIDYDITLPAAAAVQLSTISGDVAAQGLRGDLKLKTISGDLKLTDVRPATVADISSVSGDVDLRWPGRQPAELSLKSVSGEVYADSAARFDNLGRRQYVGYELRGRVGGGGGPRLSLHTVSGDVFFRRE